MPDAYLGLGGNLADRLAQLTEAVRSLHESPGISVVTVSSVYESVAIGITDQPDFLNLVLRVATTLTPEALLARCLQIEADLGRVRIQRWGPRIIDIDVLLYEGVACDGERLTLPHPRMRERSFVLTPLAEIAPALTIAGIPVADLAGMLDQTGLRKFVRLPWAPTEEGPSGPC